MINSLLLVIGWLLHGHFPTAGVKRINYRLVLVNVG